PLCCRTADGHVVECVTAARQSATAAAAGPQQAAGPPAAAPPPSLGVQRQMEIYLSGLAGHKPAQPLAAEELEERARAVLPVPAYVYVAGGAGGEETVRANRDAFRRWRIVPRFLRDVSRRDLGVE